MGLRSLPRDSQRGTRHREVRDGAAFALSYYPEDVSAKNPTGRIPAGIEDSHGMYVFRNRWADEDDIIVATFADTSEHDKAWDEADAGTLSLYAYGTVFFGGPEKTRENENFSQILVDGVARQDGSDTGAKDFFEAGANGGYVIVDGGQKFSQLGLSSYKRHLLTRFNDDGSGFISTLDKMRSGSSRSYIWQGNLGNHDDDGGVTVTSGTEAGVPVFTLGGRRDGFIKGWVMAPADVSITSAGDPLQIETSGSDVDLWVVMYAGQGTAPTATISGSGLDAEITIGDATLRYDAATDRIASSIALTDPDPDLPDEMIPGGSSTGGTGSGGQPVVGQGGDSAEGMAGSGAGEDAAGSCSCRAAGAPHSERAWLGAMALLALGLMRGRRKAEA